MELFSIDINVDVGEGISNESQLFPYVTSCNIACGGHAGDYTTMKTVVKLAKLHGLKIGAHPSFHDRKNFGRQVLDISNTSLFLSLKKQINDLLQVLKEEHLQLHHVKPHGALYNLAAKDKDTAMVIIELIKSIKEPIGLYVPYGSVIANLAMRENVSIMYEAFADRNYNEDLSLVSRNEANAIISKSDEVFNHVLRMIKEHRVKAITGIEVYLIAETFCIHGDNPEVLGIVKTLTKKLYQNNVLIQ